ncbi:synaptosomal-associated protein 47 [Sciurus carolinensis]|uniref:synaptosomal-associated protein 47 n=1 Tax=Sciurus carolinensis TaxID=30640 RepID=UPI001FB51F17|nr:synaptosomal-associated protein 47 [Sciurus carolinensis]
MSADVCLYSWPCSYYLDLEKRWVPGKLSLRPRSLQFTTERAGAALVGVPLCSVVAIRKEATHLIFSAITVLERSRRKHWFSSLQPSRNAVFSVIEHFWRELLLAQPGAAAEQTPSPSTKGQELTGLMASSQRRLEDAAKALHHQGEQLESVMQGLQKMESDLDVADRLLTELESPSWWPFSAKLWKMPAEVKRGDSASGAGSEPSGKDRVLIKVPAVVSQGPELHVRPGGLAVLASGLEIRDSSAALLHRFEREDVDDIRVHSPYEISVRQRFIGRPDVAYRVISAKMPEVIPILEVQFGKKVERLPAAAGLRSTGASSPTERRCSSWRAGLTRWDCLTSDWEPLELRAKLTLFLYKLTQVENTAEIGVSRILQVLCGAVVYSKSKLETKAGSSGGTHVWTVLEECEEEEEVTLLEECEEEVMVSDHMEEACGTGRSGLRRRPTFVKLNTGGRFQEGGMEALALIPGAAGVSLRIQHGDLSHDVMQDKCPKSLTVTASTDVREPPPEQDEDPRSRCGSVTSRPTLVFRHSC